MLLFLLLPGAVLALDQTVKLWAANTLRAVRDIPLIQGVFHLTYAENTGAAFSFLQGGRIFFLVVTPLALAGLLWLAARGFFPTRLSRLAAACMLGGTLGNFVDRLRLGYVIDLFNFRLIGFPIFNVADIALTAGVGLLFIYVVRSERAQKQASPDAQAEEAGHANPPTDHSA